VGVLFLDDLGCEVSDNLERNTSAIVEDYYFEFYNNFTIFGTKI
jgi:hypothetical protein